MASGDHPLLRPAVSLVYAALIAAVLLAIDQIVAFMPGAWFNLLAACVVALCVTTVVILSLAAWRRYREGLNRRAVGWAGAALAAALLGGVAGVELVDSAQLAAQIPAFVDGIAGGDPLRDEPGVDVAALQAMPRAGKKAAAMEVVAP